jgi:hypothetical protein
MGSALSKTMLGALEVATDKGALVRLNGGFWTWPGCPSGREGVPVWYVGWSTINALVLRGKLRVTGRAAANYATRVEPAAQPPAPQDGGR